MKMRSCQGSEMVQVQLSKAYAAKHNLYWGFVRDKDNQLYINNTEFAEDMADEHWVPLTQEF